MAIHEDLARIVTGTTLDEIDAKARDALKATIVDTIGCAAASAPETFADAALRACVAIAGRGSCTVIGRAETLAPGAAAMMNGTLAHGYDFDDVHTPSVGHLSTAVVPAALAGAELFQCDGRRFLEAVLVGDEVGGRLGWAVCSPDWGGSSIRARGFFPTAILGTVAAAAAVARVAGLSTERTAHAIAIAASYAAGLAGISRGDNSTKRTQAGWAAQSGLSAALLAAEGFTGIESVLETRQGFLEAFTGNMFHPEAFARAPGAPWICQEMSFKPYPIEHIIQPLVELAHGARASLQGKLDAITRIEASASARFVTLFEPREAKIAPPDRFMALMSAPYCIARALTKPAPAQLCLADFREDYVLDARLHALAAKVTFTADGSFDRTFPLHVGGALRFFTGDTLLWEGRLDDVNGSPQRPLPRDQLMAKYMTNCSALGERQALAIAAAIEALEDAPDASWIAALRRHSA